MKAFTYLRCYFYNALNWNIRLATFLLFNDIKGEKKYGINTSGLDELKSMEKAGIDISNNSIYTPVSYYLLENTFLHIPATTRKHFIDFGSGLGRAMCVAAHYGFKKVSGIDFSREFCEKAKHNIAITKHQIPSLKSNIINNDAFYYDIPNDADCLFFFNPFNDIIMSGVVNNVLWSLEKKPRELYIVYINPIYKELWTEAGFSEIYHTEKLKYLEQSILVFKP